MDIKPENVFVDGDGTIVVGDFGAARKISEKSKTIKDRVPDSTKWI
jgi:serine/threonine protein kinase